MTPTTQAGATSADETKRLGKSVSATALAGMLRSRIERAAKHQSETISLGQSFADQLHRFLLEAGHGSEHDAGIWDVSDDGSGPDSDRGADWGLRARQAHLEALSRRAAGGKWFTATNGADGLARIDNGTEAMFPVRCEWFEAEFIEALVNAYRRGDFSSQAQDVTPLRDALSVISNQYVTHRGDLEDDKALAAIKQIADRALSAARQSSNELKPCPWEEPHLCCYPDCTCASDREPSNAAIKSPAVVPESVRRLLDQEPKFTTFAINPEGGPDVWVEGTNRFCREDNVLEYCEWVSSLKSVVRTLIADAPPSGRAAEGRGKGDGGQRIIDGLNDAIAFARGDTSRGRMLQVQDGKIVEAAPPASDEDTEELRISKDGNAWCCLLGVNIQDGVAGFGDTPDEALKDFHRKLSGDVLPALRAALKASDETLREAVREHRTLDWLLEQEAEGRGVLAANKAALATAPAAPEPAAGGDTLETIAQWCEETFGPITPERIATRANEEMIELLAEPTKVEEAADVVIVLSRYPGLREAIDRKMKVNRARRWRFMGDGTGYHIKADEAPSTPTRADAGAEGRRA